MLSKIDHVGFAVRDLEQSLKIYTDLLGLKCIHIEVLSNVGIRIAFIPLGEVLIELLAPMNDESSIAKFIAQKGEGMHHIAYRVRHIDEALKKLKQNGIKLRDEKGRPGGAGALIAFLAPESTNDVLTELVQREKDLI